MVRERRSGQRYQADGAIVFYRREHEAEERERLGILENIGPGGLLLATREELPAGVVLHMRIYSQLAPPGQSEVTVRGTVQRRSENPKGVAIRFLDAGDPGSAVLQGLIAALGPSLRPAPVQAMACA